MYENYFNFKMKPFELTPNPECLFPSASHKKALAYINYGISERTGFILLTGEIGTGKTTLINRIIQQKLQKNVTLSRLFNTRVEDNQLLALINQDFGLSPSGKDKPTLLKELYSFLLASYVQRKPAVLVIDEAQNLAPEMLEEVRLLSNFETGGDKLLQIILVGQPELRQTLAKPELRQLRQRIQIHCHISPLSLHELELYILHRMESAGNKAALEFETDCFERIHGYTTGLPRLVNILCDYILLDAYSNQTRRVSAATIDAIATDLSFTSYYRGVPPPPPPKEPEQQTKKPQQVLVHPSLGRLTSLIQDIHDRLERLETQKESPASVQYPSLMSFLAQLNKRTEETSQSLSMLRQDLNNLLERAGASPAPREPSHEPPARSIALDPPGQAGREKSLESGSAYRLHVAGDERDPAGEARGQDEAKNVSIAREPEPLEEAKAAQRTGFFRKLFRGSL